MQFRLVTILIEMLIKWWIFGKRKQRRRHKNVNYERLKHEKKAHTLRASM
jgi:hypothetical protein